MNRVRRTAKQERARNVPLGAFAQWQTTRAVTHGSAWCTP